ncbi:hypothetical protein P8C59_007991 [Phyllachora maydis]|uniref:Eisosome protein 1 n=1 Tax=Phyllachora maydis TaxID=1825666 RepID=A0AAD9ME41_9PEZI|nr:hypothetical protein P8C59_007991 [Phyllachora maydis]
MTSLTLCGHHARESPCVLAWSVPLVRPHFAQSRSGSSDLTCNILKSGTTPSDAKGRVKPLMPPVGQSGRLRYADPRDLPSYPSVGLKKDDAAASAAASLGWANCKTFEHWKPDSSASASAAAALASDYKMATSREPERSDAGSKAAALAAGSAQRQHQPKSDLSPSAWGNSAANIAFKAKSSAATSLALSSATSNLGSIVSPENAGAVPFTNMGRAMFTSHPPVQSGVDEQRRADVLHASAVAMAKRMYTQQQRMIDSAKRSHHGRSSSFSRHGEVASDEETVQPMRFDNLQEAAYRLAQERLAKLHEEHQKNREFQEYYGSAVGTLVRRSKFGTIQRKLTRRRSASDGVLFAPSAADDEKASQRIRQQMSLFNTKLSQIDEQKRARDREALIAAAQRNVKAQLQGIDKRVFEETGRVAPSEQGSWEQRVQKAALLRAATSRDPNKGKIDIGGGKFMDTKAIDEIAAKKVQPLLDEINEKAEVERERQIALRMDEERRKSEAETEKQRQKEVAELLKKLKDENKEKDKARREELKKEERARKEQEKINKANTERALRGEEEVETAEGSDTTDKAVTAESPESKPRKMTLPFLKTKSKEDKEKANEKEDEEEKKGGSGGFIGGVTLARLKSGAKNNSTPSIENRSASMREVAMAGAASHRNPVGDELGETSYEMASRGRADDAASECAPSIVRSASSASSEENFYDAKRGSTMTSPTGTLSPPPATLGPTCVGTLGFRLGSGFITIFPRHVVQHVQ